MSKHQLQLAGHARARAKTNDKQIDRLTKGTADLSEALGVTDAHLERLRRQAIALHGAGKWQACIEVVLGVSALGSAHPVDALLLARSYRALGDDSSAQACEAHYASMFRYAVQTQGVAEEVRA